MTLFDGVRRVAILVAVFFTIISARAIWTEGTGFGFLYEISSLGKSQGLSDFCEYGVDGAYTLSRETDDGRTYLLGFCSKAIKSADGRMLVEYRNAGGVIRMGPAGSDEVHNYMKQIAEDFHQTSAEMLAAKDNMDRMWLAQSLRPAVIVLVGLLFFRLFLRIVDMLITSMPSLRKIKPIPEQ